MTNREIVQQIVNFMFEEDIEKSMPQDDYQEFIDDALAWREGKSNAELMQELDELRNNLNDGGEYEVVDSFFNWNDTADDLPF